MARILIVDDENNIRMMMRLALQAVGYEVQTAVDGLEGLEKFSDGTIWDLVLLDQRMPGIEGTEILRQMRQRRPDAHIIMITAFGTIDLATTAMQAGATDFLRKPFTMDILRAAVEAGLQTDTTPVTAVKPGFPLSSSLASINGYRIATRDEDQDLAPIDAGEVRHEFVVSTANGEHHHCTVQLPSYLVELIKAHADCDRIPDQELFWRWFCEEALANYLWQHAEVPPDKLLRVDELTSGLKRWIDAILSH